MQWVFFKTEKSLISTGLKVSSTFQPLLSSFAVTHAVYNPEGAAALPPLCTRRIRSHRISLIAITVITNRTNQSSQESCLSYTKCCWGMCSLSPTSPKNLSPDSEWDYETLRPFKFTFLPCGCVARGPNAGREAGCQWLSGLWEAAHLQISHPRGQAAGLMPGSSPWLATAESCGICYSWTCLWELVKEAQPHVSLTVRNSFTNGLHAPENTYTFCLFSSHPVCLN